MSARTWVCALLFVLSMLLLAEHARAARRARGREFAQAAAAPRAAPELARAERELAGVQAAVRARAGELRALRQSL
ncbi:putative virion membrane protein [Equine molluscum contagiosum-like virus]|nr:putative virion membrane protein [Equine molluscum contagiosum-like virus]